jgi:hypothetical protein
MLWHGGQRQCGECGSIAHTDIHAYTNTYAIS